MNDSLRDQQPLDDRRNEPKEPRTLRKSFVSAQCRGPHDRPQGHHTRPEATAMLLPSFNADNDAPPGALCTLSVTLLAAGIGLVTAASNAGGSWFYSG